MLLKRMALCDSARCLLFLNDFQIKLTQFSIQRCLFEVQMEANKISSMLTLSSCSVSFLGMIVRVLSIALASMRAGFQCQPMKIIAVSGATPLSDCGPPPPVSMCVSRGGVLSPEREDNSILTPSSEKM